MNKEMGPYPSYSEVGRLEPGREGARAAPAREHTWEPQSCCGLGLGEAGWKLP